MAAADNQRVPFLALESGAAGGGEGPSPHFVNNYNDSATILFDSVLMHFDYPVTRIQTFVLAKEKKKKKKY